MHFGLPETHAGLASSWLQCRLFLCPVCIFHARSQQSRSPSSLEMVSNGCWWDEGPGTRTRAERRLLLVGSLAVVIEIAHSLCLFFCKFPAL